jgi:hypothetical protein
MKTIAPFGDEPNITLLVPKDRKKYIDDSKYWYGFAGETEESEGFRMNFCNEELKGFATWLLKLSLLSQDRKPRTTSGNCPGLCSRARLNTIAICYKQGYRKQTYFKNAPGNRARFGFKCQGQLFGNHFGMEL